MTRFILSKETLVTLALLLISMSFLVLALQLPEGVFDPLGPGAVPEMVSGGLVFLCLVELIRIYRRGLPNSKARPKTPVRELERTAEPTPWAFASFFFLLVLYILAFQLELGHFIVLTSFFVFASTMALRGLSKSTLIMAFMLSIGLSVVLFFVLTRFFVIRLPGAF